MTAPDVREKAAIIARLRKQAETDAIRLSLHAHQEMVEDGVSYEQLREVLTAARILENYPDHRRGACCLVCGQTKDRRFVHVVCTTALEVAIIITVYEPRPPKWVTPLERGQQP
jgi:hypothetical protein